MKKVLNVEKLFSLAEKAYLVEGCEEFIYAVRENTSIPHFYEKLEKELRETPFFKVVKYKKVKEGHAYVTRAHEILLHVSDLLSQRPHLKEMRQSINYALEMPNSFSLSDFIKKNYSLCCKKHFLLKDCLEVSDFLRTNRWSLSGLLPRQIPHTLSTKIIGKEALLLGIFAFEHSLIVSGI